MSTAEQDMRVLSEDETRFQPVEQKPARKRRGRGLLKLLGLLPLIAILVYWQLTGDPMSTSAPPPSTWWTAFKVMYEDGTFMPAFWITLSTFLEALVAVTIMGVVLGIAIGASRRFHQTVNPLFEFIRTTPPAAIVPVAVLIFGISRRLTIGIIVVGAI